MLVIYNRLLEANYYPLAKDRESERYSIYYPSQPKNIECYS